MGGDVAVLNVRYVLSSVGGGSGVEGEGDGRGCRCVERTLYTQ